MRFPIALKRAGLCQLFLIHNSNVGWCRASLRAKPTGFAAAGPCDGGFRFALRHPTEDKSMREDVVYKGKLCQPGQSKALLQRSFIELQSAHA